jgi:hypothetical protein
MLTERTNCPGIAPGEIVVNKAELDILKKLAELGEALMDRDHLQKSVRRAQDEFDKAADRCRKLAEKVNA